MNWKSFGLTIGQRLGMEFALRGLGAGLRALPEERLTEWLVRFGKAFGPKHLRHFSELTPNEQYELFMRAPILRFNHDDFPAPFRWIPRRWTTWVGPAPTVLDVLDGNANGSNLKPVPAKGEWYILRGYMASTTEEGVHNRLGWRYDDVDDYWTLSATVKVFA